MVKKTKRKVRSADIKAAVKATPSKARMPAAESLKVTKRTEASLPRTRKKKEPILQINELQPREIQRAELASTNCYSLVVDGQIKAHFDGHGAAKKAAKDLLTNYPMLKVEIHDASTKQRTLVSG